MLNYPVYFTIKDVFCYGKSMYEIRTVLENEKKAFKDEHANQVMEEVTLDEKGNRSVKRQKILKDRDGLETFVQEVIDDRGNKTITKTTKHTKDKTLIEEEKLAKNGQVYKSQKIVQMF